MFFVNSIACSPSNPGSCTGNISGFAWLNQNGVAIASNVFFPTVAGTSARFDTLAHEIGHNLNLDHTTFGAGTVCTSLSTGGCNVLTSGTLRAIPSSTGCSSTTTPFGLMFDLATGLCGTSAPASGALADQILLQNGALPSICGGGTQNTQQGEALISCFLNPVPNVNATAGGGDVEITVTFPKLKDAGGRQGQYIFAIVLALPSGFQFGSNLFTQTGGTAQIFSFEQLNGNNGQGNTNCLKPLSGAPSVQCLEIDFVPGTFTANTSISFTSQILDKSTGQDTTLSRLACTPPSPGNCLDLTYVFSDLLATSSAFVLNPKTGDLQASSQLPDAGVQSTIVDPSTFPSVANLNPPLTFSGFTQTGCTPNKSGQCPPHAHGDPTGPD
jgi:Metallo-peptidase family M12B Reprolysin-like